MAWPPSPCASPMDAACAPCAINCVYSRVRGAWTTSATRTARRSVVGSSEPRALMSWLASLLVALLAAAIGLVLGGFVASHAVSWYRISSFEGGSGYFVVALALLGFVVGFVIGVVASRIVAASAHPSAWRAIAWSQLSVIGLAVLVGAIARFSADVPPRLNGEPLLLAVEIRWPPSQSVSPATDTTSRRLRLYASHNHVARTSRDGALWM